MAVASKFIAQKKVTVELKVWGWQWKRQHALACAGSNSMNSGRVWGARGILWKYRFRKFRYCGLEEEEVG